MQIFLKNYYFKNKIKKVKHRFKWRKPKLFFFTKTFIKSFNKKRWMKFQSLKYARRLTITQNKHKQNYINYLLTFLTKSTVFAHNFKKILFSLIANHSALLKNHISIAKLGLSKYINKKNFNYVFLLCWFYKRKQHFLSQAYLNFKIKKFYHPWIFGILNNSQHSFEYKKFKLKPQTWKHHYLSIWYKRNIKFKYISKKIIKKFYQAQSKSLPVKNRLKPYYNNHICACISQLNYFIKKFYGYKKISKIGWKEFRFNIKKPRWQTNPWRWNNRKPAWWNRREKQKWNSTVDIVYSYTRWIKQTDKFIKIPASHALQFKTTIKKLATQTKNYKLKLILLCLYTTFNQALLKKTPFLKIRYKLFLSVLKLLYKTKLKNFVIGKILYSKIAKFIGYKNLIKKVNPIIVQKLITLITYLQNSDTTKLQYTAKYILRWKLFLKKIKKQSFKITYRFFNKLLAIGRFFLKLFNSARFAQNVSKSSKRKIARYKSKQAIHLLKIYRKSFKLNLLKHNQKIILNVKKNLRTNFKSIKTFNWFQTIKFIDRQKKRRAYKQKARTFNPTQYKNYKNILKQNKLSLYRFKYFTKKNLNFNMYKKFRNIYISKFNKSLLANKKNFYLFFKNIKNNNYNILKNTMYSSLYKKNINYVIKKNTYNLNSYIAPLYITQLQNTKSNLNSTIFNKFITKVYKKQKYYTLRRLIKRQKKQTSYFLKSRFNYKKLLKQKLLPFSHLTQRTYKKRKLKRSYRWKIKKFIRLRKNSLRFTHHKIKYAKSKFKYSSSNKHSLKIYLIKNILKHQLKNLVVQPTTTLKYINIFKELFFDRWFLHIFNKKKQTAIFFEFLVKQHNNFITLFKTNPFIFLKKVKQIYYKKYKKHRIILRHYRNKIYKYIMLTRNKILQITNKKNKYKKPIKRTTKHINQYKIRIKILKKLYKKIKNRYIKTKLIWRKLNKRIITFKKMTRRERFLSNNVIKMTALKRQAFTSIKSINNIYKNFITFFQYQIIATKQRTYFNKKIFINFLINNYSFFKTNKNILIYLLKILKLNTKRQLIKNIQGIYYTNDIKTRLQTFYIQRRKRLNRYRSLQLYSKYRFNKRLFLNRKSRLRFGLTHFLKKWKRVQSIYAQKKFIVKFFLQKYYKGLNPTDFYKLRTVIKHKTNKLKYWHTKIENRADIILAKLKFTSNLWLSRYLITSKKIFFNNTLQTKTNKIYKKIPFITVTTQPTEDLFINDWQNQEANKYFHQTPVNFYQKTSETEQFLNHTTFTRLQRYIKNTFSKSNMSIFNTYKTTCSSRKPKMSRFLPPFKKFRRIKFFRKKHIKFAAKNLKYFNQSSISDLIKNHYNKNINFGTPKFMLYRTRKNNRGPFANLVQHNKYRTTYTGSWYSTYLTKLQQSFTTFNQNENQIKIFTLIPAETKQYNAYIQTLLSQTIYQKLTTAEQPKYNSTTITLFNTTKNIATGVLTNHFNSWRRTFELKLHRRFKYKNRKRPRVLRTNFTKNHNNTLFTYDFLNFLRFSKI